LGMREELAERARAIAEGRRPVIAIDIRDEERRLPGTPPASERRGREWANSLGYSSRA